MNRRAYRLSRPVYEALPWFYVGCGLVALLASYFQESKAISLILGLLGLTCVLGGVVVLLRRRDFRELSAHYDNSDSSELGRRD
jgi:hypothetical protein